MVERGNEEWTEPDTTHTTSVEMYTTKATTQPIGIRTHAIAQGRGRNGIARKMWRNLKRVHRNVLRPAEPVDVMENTESSPREHNHTRDAKRKNVHSASEDGKGGTAHVKEQLKNMRMLAAVAPFAAVSTTNATFPLIVQALASFLKIYLLLLFLRVLLTWFPNFDWMVQPWVTLRQVTDPYLNLFRGFVPPLMGQIDFTPVVGFLLLQWLHETLESSTESLW